MLGGEQINLGACLITVLFGFVALSRLQRLCRDDYRFIFRSYLCWLSAWIVWVALWTCLITVPNSIAVPLLGDLNSALMILFYYGLTRGKELDLAEYLTSAVVLIGVLAVMGFALLFFLPALGLGMPLHERWSLVLSIFTTVLIGWGVRSRYGTPWVLIVGLVYGLAQAPTYEALFPQASVRVTEDLKQVVLTSLALLKLVLAFAVMYPLGSLPNSAESLVKPPLTKYAIANRDKLWPMLPIAMLILGILTVFGLSKVRIAFSTDAASFGTWLTILAAGLGGIYYISGLLDRFLKWRSRRP
jgi:hypothetical protein